MLLFNLTMGGRSISYDSTTIFLVFNLHVPPVVVIYTQCTVVIALC